MKSLISLQQPNRSRALFYLADQLVVGPNEALLGSGAQRMDLA